MCTEKRHEKTPREKKAKMVSGRGKQKSEILGGSGAGGPAKGGRKKEKTNSKKEKKKKEKKRGNYKHNYNQKFFL